MTCLEGDCPSFALVSVDAEASSRPAAPIPGLSIGDPADGLADPRADRADRRVHRPPLRHRRHRRGHRQPDPRHGGDARRAHRARPRPDRAVAEGRTGRQRPAHLGQRHADVQPRQLRRRRLLAGLRPPRRRQRHATAPAPGPAGRSSSARRRRRRPGRWSPTRRRRTPSSTLLTGRLAEVSRPRRTTATRTPRRSPAGCSATRRPPTSSSSASPCRPGRSPSRPPLIERAIELNGVAVQRNVTAFRWGRRWHVAARRGRAGRRRSSPTPSRRRSTS